VIGYGSAPAPAQSYAQAQTQVLAEAQAQALAQAQAQAQLGWGAYAQAATAAAAAAVASPPQRPGETPCAFYLKTGQCKVDGKFNQHRRCYIISRFIFLCRGYYIVGLSYFSQFGATCRYDHPPRAGAGDQPAQDSVSIGSLPSFMFAAPGGGLPRRHGQEACKFFLKTGSCSFGVTCR
jgi:hypothetical protein